MSDENTNAEVEEVNTATAETETPPPAEEDIATQYRPVDDEPDEPDAGEDEDASADNTAVIKEWVKFAVFVVVLFGAVFVVWASRPLVFESIVPAVMNARTPAVVTQEQPEQPTPPPEQTEATEPVTPTDDMDSNTAETTDTTDTAEEPAAAESESAPLVIQEESSVTVDEAAQPEESSDPPADEASPPAEAAGDARTIPYTVQGGDTLYDISERYGVSINDILAANPGAIPNPNNILPGTEIQIPVP